MKFHSKFPTDLLRRQTARSNKELQLKRTHSFFFLVKLLSPISNYVRLFSWVTLSVHGDLSTNEPSTTLMRSNVYSAAHVWWNDTADIQLLYECDKKENTNRDIQRVTFTFSLSLSVNILINKLELALKHSLNWLLLAGMTSLALRISHVLSCYWSFILSCCDARETGNCCQELLSWWENFLTIKKNF